MRLDGKVSLITGAATGIGEVSALLFAEEGAKIVVADVKASEGLETVNKIKKSGYLEKPSDKKKSFVCDRICHSFMLVWTH